MSVACVIGGAGFLGSHVADQLTDSGYAVRIFDVVASRWCRPAQRMIVGDVLDLNSVRQAVAGADVVYHFAALADLDAARDKPLETVQVNVQGTVNALEACRTGGVKRFVYASTVYLYRRQGGFYRCSSQAAELYVEEYQRTYELDFTILRYGSLYGPRSDETNGLYQIVRAALETGTISYYGNPESMREYIHVE